MLTLQSSPGPASSGVTESRGKFVAGKRLFSGLFPMRARRFERPGDTLLTASCAWRQLLPDRGAGRCFHCFGVGDDRSVWDRRTAAHGFSVKLVHDCGRASPTRCIPHAVTAGFTYGTALTIFASQLKELAGITSGDGKGSLLSPLTIFSQINPAALVIGTATAAAIFALQRWRPGWPAHPAGVPCRGPGRGLLEHDREGTDCQASPYLAVRAGPAGYVRIDRGDQPDSRYPRGLSRLDRSAMENHGRRVMLLNLTQVNEPIRSVSMILTS